MEYGTFLVRFHSVMESAENDEENDDEEVLGPMVKPKLEERRFKSHTLDNVRVRKLCDELLYLEDMSYKMRDPSLRQRGWMPTLQVMMGKHVNGLEIRHNPDLTIGGYFLLAQMLTLTRGLTHLDLSGNNITSADARVLALGIGSNCSVQQLRMKENNIGSEGATNFADSLKKNKTLLILDLRMNNIRGNGVCVLADALSLNRSLTKLDLSWNYAGDSSDYVECALLDLKKFCRRNTDFALNDIRIAIGNPTGTRPTVARQQLFSPPAVTPQGSKLSQQTDRVSHGDISAAVQQAQAIQDRQLAHENWVSDEELNASMRSQEGAPLELLSQSPGGAAAMEDETSSAALSRKETQTSDGDITAAAMAGRFREKDSPAPNVRGSPAPAGAAPLAVPHRLRDAGGEEGQCTHGLRAELDSGVAKECIGRVEITVLSCKNLPQVIWTTGRNGEFLGQPQPYCTVSVCNEEHATGVRPRSFTPSWDNMCTMSVASVWNVATVTVMHTRSKRQRPPGQRRGDSNIGAVSVPVGSVMNWRGVSKTTDGSYRAFHRPFASPTGTVYTVCAGKDAQGNEVDSFGSAVQAALAYDEGGFAQGRREGAAQLLGRGVGDWDARQGGGARADGRGREPGHRGCRRASSRRSACASSTSACATTTSRLRWNALRTCPRWTPASARATPTSSSCSASTSSARVSFATRSTPSSRRRSASRSRPSRPRSRARCRSGTGTASTMTTTWATPRCSSRCLQTIFCLGPPAHPLRAAHPAPRPRRVSAVRGATDSAPRAACGPAELRGGGERGGHQAAGRAGAPAQRAEPAVADPPQALLHSLRRCVGSVRDPKEWRVCGRAGVRFRVEEAATIVDELDVAGVTRGGRVCRAHGRR